MPFVGLTGPTLASGYAELSESIYDDLLEQPLHGHEPAYLTLVLQGGYQERIGRTERAVQSGALLFHSAGEEHAVRFAARRTHVFRLRPLAPMLEAARLSRGWLSTVLEHTDSARPILARMRAAYGTGDQLSALTIDGLCCELVACCAVTKRRTMPGATGAAQVRDIIESSLDCAHSLDRLAVEAGCHPITLTRAFRRAFGCSIGSYIRRRRLEVAVQLLRSTDIPISVVAARCGFADQAHFTRALRRACGRTPGRLRDLRAS